MSIIREDVIKALESEETTTPEADSSTPQEEVSSQEVKTEASNEASTETLKEVKSKTSIEPEKKVSLEKQQEQIDNLTNALRLEREAKKQDAEKIAMLVKELNEAKQYMSKLKEVFAPQPEPSQESPVYLTQDQVEKILEERENRRKQEQEEQMRAQQIQAEISALEKEWDGVNGKPKYDDQEVLKWQKENNKLYLSPSEAFAIMKRNEITDWEVRQRLAGKKPAQEVEQPSIEPGVHQPIEKKIKTEQELRQAVVEAINMAEAEM